MMIRSPSTSEAVPRFETDYDEDVPVRNDLIVSPRVTWWSAIVAGAFTAISIQVIFAVLGTAIGLSVFSGGEDALEAGLSIGAAMYWLVTGLISLFIGGYVASRMRNTANGRVGAIHGFLTWCTVTVLSMLLLAMAGGAAIGGSLAVVGDAMAANGGNERASLNRDSDSMSRESRTVTEQERKEAAKNAAGASWWTLIALVLGATVASIGGRSGARDPAPRTRTSAHLDRTGAKE